MLIYIRCPHKLGDYLCFLDFAELGWDDVDLAESGGFYESYWKPLAIVICNDIRLINISCEANNHETKNTMRCKEQRILCTKRFRLISFSNTVFRQNLIESFFTKFERFFGDFKDFRWLQETIYLNSNSLALYFSCLMLEVNRCCTKFQRVHHLRFSPMNHLGDGKDC